MIIQEFLKILYIFHYAGCTKRYTATTKSFIQVDVYSAGHYVGNRFSMNKDWDEFYGGRKAGINLVLIDEVNGSVIVAKTFRTYTSGYSNQLITFVENIPFGSIVCAAISHDGVAELSLPAKQTLAWLGSSDIYNVPRYGSWALIGVKGALPGQALEVYEDQNSPAQVSARITLKPYRKKFFEITAQSAGKDYGNYAIITLNGTAVDIPYVGHDRGLHVMVVDEVTSMIVHRQVFDTSAETGAYSSSSQFVELIQSLPDGRFVAIAIKEEGFDHLSDEAKRACESLGSALIWQVRHKGSWAIIGQKGAENGSVPEAIGNAGISKSYLVHPQPLPEEKKPSCFITMQALNLRGIGSYISVNGFHINHTGSAKEGSLVVSLKDGKCEVERYKSFTSSYDLSEFIKYTPHGRTVLVNIAYHYRALTVPGSVALEAIGSARMQSLVYDKPWVLVGRKGAPKGSIIEESYSGLGRGFEAVITVEESNTTLGFVGSVIIKSAGRDLGGYGTIDVDGQTFAIPAEYECGINMVVFEEDSSSIIFADVFNMTTSNTSDNLDIDRFVNMTDSLPPGTVVALTTNDAAGLNETEEVKVAIEQLGSRYINQAIKGGSWGMMGQKGAKTHPALEATSKDGPVEILTHTSANAETLKNTTCKIFVESSGSGSHGGLHFLINGRSVDSSQLSGEGIRLVIMKQQSCEVESIISYPTHAHYSHSNNLASRIGNVPHGVIVIASVYGSGHESNPNSHYSYWRYRQYYRSSQTALSQAFRSIGSSLFGRVSYRDAWAIIGRKGATPGSVPESHVRSLGHELSSAVAVGGSMDIFGIGGCKSDLYPIDCLLHD